MRSSAARRVGTEFSSTWVLLFWDLVSVENAAEELRDECHDSTRLLEQMTGRIVAEAFAFVPDGTGCAAIDVVFADDRRFAIQCFHDVDGHHTEADLIR